MLHLEPRVSVKWLQTNLEAPNLVILDASIKKVTEGNSSQSEKHIPKTLFFDIKNAFSDVTAPFPNTVPSAKQFTVEAQKIGINTNSLIIVYDDKGIYSSARAWYLFKTFGFKNVAVLDGGLPEWINAGYAVEKKQKHKVKKGNFIALYNPTAMKCFSDIKIASKDINTLIVDARSAKRFQCLVPEPRKGLRMGTIPSSINLPYTNLLIGNYLKPKEELTLIFDALNLKNMALIFSCGSGITACILALGAEVSGYKNTSVYDGSWTEYGSLTEN